MMGIQNGQIQMIILDINSMIPENHLLRQIKNGVNFDFIYEKAAPYYSNLGRKSIDPVILIKMLVRINTSAYYPSFHRNNQKVGTSDYLRVMRLRQIWAEGTFAVLKREHKLNKIQKRGLQKATEECLLSATALNLKRLVKTV